MDRRLWGAAAVVVGLFAAAWIYMDVQERNWQYTSQKINRSIQETDNLAQEVQPETPMQRAQRRANAVAERMRALPAEQNRRTDSLKKVIAQDNLLGNESASRSDLHSSR